MKAVRIIGSILLGIIIFSLIFSYSILLSTKNFLVGNLLTETVRATVKENIEDVEGQKKLVDDMFEDGEAKDIIYMIIDNYSKYHEDSANYKVSQEDADKLYNFLNKYRKENIKLYGENISKMTEEEFKEYFSYEKINEFANDSFKTLDEDLNVKDVDRVLWAYDIATSNSVKVLFIMLILIFVAILILINKPMIKGLIVLGVDLIISGIIITFIYISGNILAENFLNEMLKKDYHISFGSYLTSGIFEVVLGIALIIGTIIIKNKFLNQNDVVKE